ncbi:hypothetical protein COHA_006694 [Chlorella ohadii]|uniref:Uncharacterized protein n=1 Tax=Chlorella ohadii TaxID=2649997 RepID=A0AAD5H3L0_9CHLO|nr:hypothetical protein COHA_006694 [Chlorella ohadii]
MASAASILSLVRQLRSSSRVAQLQAAKTLPRLTENGGDAAAEAVVAAGGVPALLSLLSTGSGTAQLAAASTLYNLVDASCTARAAICAADGVAALLQLLSSSSPVLPKALQLAACALAGLIQEPGGPDPVPAILAADGIPVVTALLSHSSETAQAGAAGAIAAMAARGSPFTLEQLRLAGAVQAVVRCLLGGRDAVLLRNAACALTNLMRPEGKPQTAVDAAASGALPFLLRLLDSSDGSKYYFEAAAGALCNMCGLLDLVKQREQQQLAAIKAELMLAGAAAATARLLRRQGSTVVQHAAAAMVQLLARGDEAASAELVAAGVMTSLMEVDSEDESLQRAVVAAEQCLADTSPEAAAVLEAALASESDEAVPEHASLGSQSEPRCGWCQRGTVSTEQGHV